MHRLRPRLAPGRTGRRHVPTPQLRPSAWLFAAAVLALCATSAGAFPPAGPYEGRLGLGEGYNCVLQLDGSVDCWGWNHRGQATDHPGPFVEIAVGAFHQCGLYADGTAECWGDGRNGETAPQSGVFAQMAPGDGFTCGLRPTGDVECWGKNNVGQATPNAGPFDRIESGSLHACGFRNDGSMECWGYDRDGRLAGLPAGGGGREGAQLRAGARRLGFVLGVQPLGTGQTANRAVRSDRTELPRYMCARRSR